MGLIEVIVGIALMLIVFTALFGALRTSLELSMLAKAKTVATELATSQMEYLRSLPYTSLGTVGGTPSGTITQNATSTVSGAPYGVRTYIIYYDDPADGTGGADIDSVTQDYKKAKIVVTYSIHERVGSVTLVSSFAPPEETP
jgi:hypothetical protein